MPWNDLDALTPQALNSRSGIVFNVKDPDFGAAGDGVTDDAAAIQSALDTAGTIAANGENGAVVLLPRGSFICKAQVVIPGFVSLRGVGSRSSRLLADSTFPINTALVRLGDGTGIVHGTRLDNLRVDCQDIAGSIGVFTNEAQENSGVFGCVVAGYRDIGIDVASGANHAWFRDLEIFPSDSFATAAGMRFKDVSGVNYVQGVSIVGIAAAPTSTDGIVIDGSFVILIAIHVERHTDGVHFVTGTSTSGMLLGLDGHSSLTNCVHLDSTVTGVNVFNVTQGGATVTLLDDAASESITGTVARWTSAGRDFIRNESTSMVARRVMLASGQTAAADQILDSDGNILYAVASNGEIQLIASGANVIHAAEISDPAAPSANRGKLYMRDNGSGKTQLVVRFNSGAVQVVATEP